MVEPTTASRSVGFQSIFSWKASRKLAWLMKAVPSSNCFNPYSAGRQVGRMLVLALSAEDLLFQSIFSWKASRKNNHIINMGRRSKMFQSIFSWKASRKTGCVAGTPLHRTVSIHIQLEGK